VTFAKASNDTLSGAVKGLLRFRIRWIGLIGEERPRPPELPRGTRQERVELRFNLFHPVYLLPDLRPEYLVRVPEPGRFGQNRVGTRT
jgi:hypothetical protein